MNARSMAGWIGFAGMLLLIVGSIDFFQGLIALLDDEYFVVTASGLSFFGISGAFWGLVAGGVILAMTRWRDRRKE